MKTSRVVIIHLLFWLLIVVAPTILFRLDNSHRGPDIGFLVQQNIINVIIFYLTYWLLIPILMKRKSTVELVLLSIAWLLVLASLRMGLIYYIKEVIKPLQGRPFVFEKQVFRDLFGTLMFSLYPVLIYFSIEWFKERRYRFELTREKQKSEIDLLKSQINPHFLMNTLNNLYSLVYKGSDKASEAVLKLSDIMRYMLYDTKSDLVPLDDEINYLRAFVELQMLRISNKELVEFKVTGETEGRMIAPMLFIPFVENAFKHGNKQTKGKGISIEIQAVQKMIVLEVTNYKASLKAQKDLESGIGLLNVRKRLKLQYPDKNKLTIVEDSGSFNVHLVIFDQ
jgi:hypothetical protein